MIRAITKTAILLPALLSMILISTAAISAPIKKANIQIGNLSYSGSACPRGSVTAKLNKKQARLHVNFNKYIVEVHGRNKKSLRKTCSIAIPIKVPAGVSISLVNASYRGKVSLPTGSHARIVNSYSFSGRRGKRFKTDLHGPNNKGYNFRDPLSSFASVWSACGKNTTLRITTSTRIKTGESGKKTLADSRQGLVTQLKYRSCQ